MTPGEGSGVGRIRRETVAVSLAALALDRCIISNPFPFEHPLRMIFLSINAISSRGLRWYHRTL
jgi:hypothetical protein